VEIVRSLQHRSKGDPAADGEAHGFADHAYDESDGRAYYYGKQMALP